MEFKNWVVIYPHKDKNKIKEEYDKLKLRNFTVSIVIINDTLSEKEKDEYVNFVNKNIKYSGQIEVTKESELMIVIEKMSGVNDEALYLIKNGKISYKKIKL
jgi:hypothetical protein